MHTPIDRIGYPQDDENRAPHMLAWVFLAGCLGYAIGVWHGVCMALEVWQ